MSKKIYIIDDSADLRLLYTRSLKTKGVDVTAFGLAVDALEKLAAEEVPPSLIVVDLFMPGMDGAEFVRRLRADGRYGAIKVIVSSGADGLSAISREIGADGFLRKPISLEQLQALCV